MLIEIPKEEMDAYQMWLLYKQEPPPVAREQAEDLGLSTDRARFVALATFGYVFLVGGAKEFDAAKRQMAAWMMEELSEALGAPPRPNCACPVCGHAWNCHRPTPDQYACPVCGHDDEDGD